MQHSAEAQQQRAQVLGGVAAAGSAFVWGWRRRGGLASARALECSGRCPTQCACKTHHPTAPPHPPAQVRVHELDTGQPVAPLAGHGVDDAAQGSVQREELNLAGQVEEQVAALCKQRWLINY